MGHSWISIAGWMILVSTCVFAAWKGESAERAGAAWLLLMNVCGDIVLAVSYPAPPPILMFSLDLVLAIGLLGLALRFSSLWLGAAMLLQGVSLLGHAIRLGDEGMNAYAWVVFNNVLTQTMQLCIVIATCVSWWIRKHPRVSSIYLTPTISHG